MTRIPSVLFPYGAQLFPVVQNFERLQMKYSLCRLIAPAADASIGKDAAYALNLPEIGLSVDGELDEQSADWDTLITYYISMSGDESSLFSQQVAYIERTLSAGKRICYVASSADIPDVIKSLAMLYPGRVEIVTEAEERGDSVYTPENAIKPLQTQVVLVGGLAEESDVQSVLIGLEALLKERGKRGLVVSQSPVGYLLGHVSLQHIFQNRNANEFDKICAINSELYYWEKNYMPDVILIEAPDAFARFNDATPHSFGIRTYMLSQAIVIDRLICCVPCELMSAPLVHAVSEDFAIRYGCGIDALQVSNIIIDSAFVNEMHRMSIAHTTIADISHYIHAYQSQQADIPAFNVYLPDHLAALYDVIFDNDDSWPQQANNQLPVIRHETMCETVLALLNEKFCIRKEHFEEKFWDHPLTGAPYYLSSEEMVYLFLELERTCQITFSTDQLDHYNFLTIQGILDTLWTAE